jgi:general secretion pathway protein J
MTNPNRSVSAANCSAGFTLLEVMVAMLLLAIIMTTSVTMLFINLKGWDGLTEHSDAVQQEFLIQKRVTSLIQHIVPLVWRDQKQRLLALTGANQQLQFISKAPQQHRDGGLFEYLLVQENSHDQGVSLVLYFSPHDPNAAELTLPENGTRRVLVTGLEAVEFSFFGSKQDRETTAWHDSWEAESSRYPELIRMTLRYAGDEESIHARYYRILQDYPMVVQGQRS